MGNELRLKETSSCPRPIPATSKGLPVSVLGARFSRRRDWGGDELLSLTRLSKPGRLKTVSSLSIQAACSEPHPVSGTGLGTGGGGSLGLQDSPALKGLRASEERGVETGHASVLLR